MLAVALCISSNNLRNLFIQTIMEGSNAIMLFEYCQSLTMQIPHVNPLSEDFPEASRNNDLLHDLQSRLDMHNKSLDDYGLPTPQQTATMEERHWASHNQSGSQSHWDNFMQSLQTPQEQKQCMQEILSQLQHYKTQKSQNLPLTSHYISLQGRSGSGKTEVAKAAFHWCTSNGLVAVCVAPTGLASLKYGMDGDTAHHMFSLPVNEDNHGDVLMESNCEMLGARADFLRSVDVVVWDEHANQDRHCIEAVHRLFCRLAGLTVQQSFLLPFAGKIVLGLMDFRQIAPVVPRASKSKIIDSSVCQSWLWQHRATKLVLQFSMRDKQDPLYAQFVLDLGNDSHKKHILKHTHMASNC
jgi:hypothetical protein